MGFATVCMLVVTLVLGCSGPAPTGTTDPPALLRLQRIYEFYQAYTTDKKKPPADEKALKDYIRELPADRKTGFGMIDDIDELFVSPRDKKPYVVRYKFNIEVGGETQAVAWEETGAGGSRFVALNVGYVQEYTDADFKELKKK